MYHLIIDTCVWIDLGRKFTEVRQKISQLVDKGKVILILPQIIIDEWEEHKSKIVEEKKNSIRGKIKNARGIAQFLESDLASKFREILEEFEKNEGMIEQSALNEIEAIEKLFDHNSTIKLAITEQAKSQAIDFALAKKAPFRGKNSMADALIIFTVIDYIHQKGLDNCNFISSNTEDFGAQSNKTRINEDLQVLFDECGMHYFSNIGQAINQIETDLVSSESIREIEEAHQFEVIQEVLKDYQLSLERIKAAGGFSALKETLARQEQTRQELMKSFDTTSALSAFSALKEEFARQEQTRQELIKSFGATSALSAFSALKEEFARQEQARQELMKSFGATSALSAFSALKEEFARQEQRYRELLKGIPDVGGFSTKHLESESQEKDENETDEEFNN